MLGTIPVTDRRSSIAAAWSASDAVLEAPDANGFGLLEAHATTIRVEHDAGIIMQGEPAVYCYRLIGGCARTVKLLQDGRRQISGFLFSGDLLGWEALDEHDFGVEAVTAVTLRRYPRRQLEALAAADPQVARQLRELAADQLRASRNHLLLLGRKTASERIASFLLEMFDRQSVGNSGLMDLPMGRADMADYLGLTIETVCRGLTNLRQQGLIGVERARIRIRDRHTLRRAAGCETVH
jgi:CRP-like cAMP-binding protein